MKKCFIIFAILMIAFSVSACTSKTAPLNEEKVAPTNATADEDKNLVDDKTASAPVDNSVSPVANEIQLATTSPETPVQTNKIMSPDKQEDLTKTYSQAIIKTSLGNITVKFYANESPITVNNFLNLAKAGFYNGTKFHRVIKDFMIQGGDPLSKESDTSYWGTGGPGYKFNDEFNSHKLVAGSLAMANSGPDTNGSQFFIMLEDNPLPNAYTIFGKVIKGQEIVDAIGNVKTGDGDRPVDAVIIKDAKVSN